ncbi:thioesterase family protein [Anderseniella sp. Alg231-50]|uniref:thioesterase family protein n=1 Tax=Anderseniella sp. Alg231-50 TaxID=1922226 RepID=UPI00307CB928
MKDTLRPGLTHSAALEIDQSLTVPHVSSKLEAFGDMPPVFATAFMIAFIEATCIEAIAKHLDDGEHSVGTHVDVSHLAATPPCRHDGYS